MELETKALLVAAERARVLDHRGNRGFDAEHAIREWLRRRVGPEYTVSSGEIIDAFDTDADLDSRQQDIVIHANDRQANRLVLPSGLRIIPIESVAAVVEVKLTLNRSALLDTDRVAGQTANLRLSVEWDPLVAPGAAGGVSPHAREAAIFNREKAPHGVKLLEREIRTRTTFAVFGFNGPVNIETMAEWMRDVSRVSLVTCLDTGCIYRRPPAGDARESWESFSTTHTREEALMAFAGYIDAAIDKHRANSAAFVARPARYNQCHGVSFYDSTDYEHPEWYCPTQEELEARAARFPGRAFKR
ncbi:DUF6602 domain-containing protein [Sorangium sp. So ce394]|uniref:DUF6602 domain-containing protein n=1 Tax=Sorangium sp. So ce394 TaxID=3133310 RepID=UPI003F5B1267